MNWKEHIEPIQKKLTQYQQQGKRLFATSSFQTHSIPMLHILSQIDRSIPIYFINTGYLFPESIAFRDQITDLLDLNVVDHHPLTPKHLQRDADGNLYFASDPDYCCFLNKIQPLDPVLAKFDVWINGIRADQNANRKNMKEEEETPSGALRYHPMLTWNNRTIYQYINEHQLPKHPLDEKGYVSIGCEPCTQKPSLDGERGGRWFGMKKTECGLHTDLVKK